MSKDYKIDCIIKRPDEAYGHKTSIQAVVFRGGEVNPLT